MESWILPALRSSRHLMSRTTMTERDQEFLPLYAVPPGETLEELLSDRQITQTELAMRMGRPLKTINEIVQGKAAITSDTAFQLERVLGVSASFWTDLERHYREDQDRVRLVRALERDASWLDRFPLNDLRSAWHLPTVVLLLTFRRSRSELR